MNHSRTSPCSQTIGEYASFRKIRQHYTAASGNSRGRQYAFNFTRAAYHRILPTLLLIIVKSSPNRVAGFLGILVLAAGLCTARAQELAPMSFGGRAICATPDVNDPKTIQEAWVNTQLQHPGMIEAVEQMRLQKGLADPVVGDQNVFWVYNIQKQSYDTVRASLKFVGTLSYIWVALAEWNNGHVTSVEVDAMANALEHSARNSPVDTTIGILSIDRQVYGNPPNINSSFQKGKGDGKTHFLICDIQDGFTGSNSYIAGFFYSVDVDPNSGASLYSNRRDMLYIDSYPGIYYNGSRRTPGALSTLAHEFQHLIHWNYDPYEISFFNEGLSEYAEYLCGFNLRSPAGYLANPNVTLTAWSGSLEDYSRAALWTRYVAEQFGLTFLKNFTQNTYTGIQGFEMSLSQSGFSITFAATMMNFFTANWMGSSGSDPALRYKAQLSAQPSLRASYFDPNVQRADTLVQQSVQYVSFAAARNFRITFTAPAGLTIRAIESGPGALRIRDVTRGVEFTSPELGSTYTSLVFVVGNNQPSLPAVYSFGAVGDVFLVEERYDSGTPHTPFPGSAPYLGFGNNASTLGMAVRFQPAVPGNVLRKARMMVAFNQEFSGATALPTDPMDFMFHVWGDRNGRPGSDLIVPLFVRVDRNSTLLGSFVDIDLSAYQKQLTNLPGPVYLGFMEASGDSVGTYLAVDNYVADDYSFVYRGPNYTRLPNAWETMREVSAVNNHALDGFNLLVRAVFQYSDSSTAPPLSIGYLQNPLLSEYIDVVAASSFDLRNASLSGTLTQGGSSSNLKLYGIPGTAKAYMDTTQKLKASGTVSIRVRGAKKYGVFYSDTTISLSARLLKADERATVSSPGGTMTVSFDAGSWNKQTYVTLSDGANNPLLASSSSANPLKVYSLGPAGTELNRACLVSVSGLTSDDGLTLAVLHDGKWLSLPTTQVKATGELHASTKRLGVLGVMKKSDVQGELESVPTQFALAQNYPNPFNPSTTIEFDIPRPSKVRLIIYDVLGKEVVRLVDGERSAGHYAVRFNASQVPSGVYFCRLSADGFSQSQKVVVLK